MSTQYKNIVIFGRSRAGKSTLADKICDLFPYHIIKTDPLRDSFAHCFKDLNIEIDTAYNHEQYQFFLYDYMCRMTYEAHNQYGMVMEGFEIPISAIMKYYLNDECLVYCLGTLNITPEEFAENIKKLDKPYDWTYSMNDKDLLEFAKNEIIASEKLIQLCHQYHIPFFNTAIERDDVFNDVIKDVQKKYKKKSI